MKTYVSTIGLLFLLGCATESARHPASQTSAATGAQVFRLHSGRKVLLPKRSDSVDYVFLQGTANIEALNEVLSDEDLVAVSEAGIAPAPDHGRLGVIVAKYNSSSLGPHQEVMVVISARPKAIKDSGAFTGNLPIPAEGTAPVAPYFVWRTQVDSPIALEMGREFWGYPTSMGAIDLTTKAADWTFKLSEKGKGLIFDGKCGNCGLVGKQKLDAKFTFISSYSLRRTPASIQNSGPTLVRPYDPRVDAFNLKPNTVIAKMLTKVGFKPDGWFVGENLSTEEY